MAGESIEGKSCAGKMSLWHKRPYSLHSSSGWIIELCWFWSISSALKMYPLTALLKLCVSGLFPLWGCLYLSEVSSKPCSSTTQTQSIKEMPHNKICFLLSHLRPCGLLLPEPQSVHVALTQALSFFISVISSVTYFLFISVISKLCFWPRPMSYWLKIQHL